MHGSVILASLPFMSSGHPVVLQAATGHARKSLVLIARGRGGVHLWMLASIIVPFVALLKTGLQMPLLLQVCAIVVFKAL